MEDMKILTPILLSFFFTQSSYAQLSFKWLGITGFSLSDGKTTLLFDPAITRVGFLDYLPFTKVQTDPAEVDFWMNRCGLKSIDATFINHAHSDHVIDAPYVTKRYGGKLFGSSSTVNLGLGHGLKKEQVQEVKQGQSIQVGDFTVEPYFTPHAPHFLDIMLMDGHIAAPLASPASAWDYKVGDTFSYLIRHPKGVVLYQAIAKIYDNDPLKGIKADALLLTIANRPSTEHLIEKRIKPIGARTVIPLHFDNFFFRMKREGEIDQFWGVKTEEFQQKMKTNVNAKILWPKYCEEVNLL